MPRKSSRNLIVAQDDGMLMVKVKTCLRDCVDRSEVREVAFNPRTLALLSKRRGGGQCFLVTTKRAQPNPLPPPCTPGV